MSGLRAEGRVDIATYRVYGTSIATEHRFSVPLPLVPGPGELTFSCSEAPPAGADWSTATVVAEEGERSDGESIFVFAALADRDVVRITGAVEFHLWPSRIACHVLDPRHSYLVDIALFGMVLALWLERRGVPVLHGSAVVIDGSAVAFLAGSGAGKTSLAAAALARGHELLTEDLLAIDGVQGRPGYPMLRLWPEQASRFVGEEWRGLEQARPDTSKLRAPVGALREGRFRESSAPLRRLYLPERHQSGSTAVEVTEATPQEAVLALVRHSFLPTEVHTWGLQPARLGTLARLTAEAPVARLRYPSGYDRLPEVIAAVEEDLQR